MDGHGSRHIVEALRLARQMIILADEGDGEAVDDSCRLLFGTIRDCAYRIRAQAERERDAHKAKGIWEQQGGQRDREMESDHS